VFIDSGTSTPPPIFNEKETHKRTENKTQKPSYMKKDLHEMDFHCSLG
jgi:hypothetical protein